VIINNIIILYYKENISLWAHASHDIETNLQCYDCSYLPKKYIENILKFIKIFIIKCYHKKFQIIINGVVFLL